MSFRPTKATVRGFGTPHLPDMLERLVCGGPSPPVFINPPPEQP